MREVTRVRQMQVMPSGQEILEYTAPEVLVSELNRMMTMLSSLRPVYPVVGMYLFPSRRDSFPESHNVALSRLTT